MYLENKTPPRVVLYFGGCIGTNSRNEQFEEHYNSRLVPYVQEEWEKTWITFHYIVSSLENYGQQCLAHFIELVSCNIRDSILRVWTLDFFLLSLFFYYNC